MIKFKEMKFKSVKSLVTLSAGLSLFLVGTLATVGIAGCTHKVESKAPCPPCPKPKPKTPVIDALKKIDVKHALEIAYLGKNADAKANTPAVTTALRTALKELKGAFTEEIVKKITFDESLIHAGKTVTIGAIYNKITTKISVKEAPKAKPIETPEIINRLAALNPAKTKDNLEWNKGFYLHNIGSGFVKDYLIAHVAPKLKFDRSKLFITSQKLDHGKTFWYQVQKDEATGLHARYAISKKINIGCDFWIWPGTWAK